MTIKDITSTGIEQLDQILGGLLIGDNVIWCDDVGSLASVFSYNFLLQSQQEEKPIVYLSFDRPPRTILERLGPLAKYNGLILLDCFTRGKGESSPVFTKFYEQDLIEHNCRVLLIEEPKDIARVNKILYDVHGQLTGDVRLIFDSLTGMQELWGGEDQLIGFYAHSCPRLYELETIAYWIMEKEAHSSRFKARLSQLAQVVIDLVIKRGATSLTIIKADDRGTQNLHRPFLYWTREQKVIFGDEKRASTGLDLGQRLKKLRTSRGYSQTDLARLIGVTPSNISQIEGNLIYPSLPALMKMAEVLGIDVCSLLKDSKSEINPVVFKVDGAPGLSDLPGSFGQVFRFTPIDLETKVEPFMIEINPGQSLSGHFFNHKGEEVGILLAGHLELRIKGQICSINPNDLIYLTIENPDRWQNPGPEIAKLIWLIVK